MRDLHCHLTPTFTIDQVMEISKKTGVQFGIMVNPGGAVSDDAGLRRFIESLKPYPVYYGLQPMSPGWSSCLLAGHDQAARLRHDGPADHSQWQ